MTGSRARVAIRSRRQVSRWARAATASDARWIWLFSVFAVAGAVEIVQTVTTFSGNESLLWFHQDFPALYAAGKMDASGSGSLLYDTGALADAQIAADGHPVGATGVLAYFNPPFFAALWRRTRRCLRIARTRFGRCSALPARDGRLAPVAHRVPTPTKTPTATATPCSNPDADGDGVCDAFDNCPNVPNADQANFDAAGIGNGPGIPGDDTSVANADGLSDACDPDIDNDGLLNGSDPDPSGDNTADDNGDGNTAVGCYGGTDAADDGPSWDTNCNGILDGRESNPICTNADTGVDTDGDGLHDRWEVCTWGTNPNVIDSDGDGLGDCKEVMDMTGNGLVTNADALFIKRAVFGIIGKDRDFDINGNGLITNADALIIQRAVFGVTPCQ